VSERLLYFFGIKVCSFFPFLTPHLAHSTDSTHSKNMETDKCRGVLSTRKQYSFAPDASNTLRHRIQYCLAESARGDEKDRIKEVSGTQAHGNVLRCPYRFIPSLEKEKLSQKLKDIETELEDDMKRGGCTGQTVNSMYKLDIRSA
jgi:hypothetical protein